MSNSLTFPGNNDNIKQIRQVEVARSMSRVSDVPVTEEDAGKGGRRRFSEQLGSGIWVYGEELYDCHPDGWRAT